MASTSKQKFDPKYINFDFKQVRDTVTALKQDMDYLYSEFLNERDYTFKSFANAWKRLKFASIMLGRNNAKNLLEFCQLTLHVSKGYLFSQQLHSQIFGVYLIYGLYYRQPFVSRPAKLRLTWDEYNDFREVLKALNEESQNEALFICNKLFNEGGFDFVAAPIEAGIEIGFRKYFGTSNEDVPFLGEEMSVDPSMLNGLERLMKIYEEKKKQVFTESEVFFGESNFVEEARKLLHIKSRSTSVVDDEEAVLGSGTSRRKAKKKAFTHGCVKSETKLEKTQEAKQLSRESRYLGNDLARGFALNVQEPVFVDEEMQDGEKVITFVLPDIN